MKKLYLFIISLLLPAILIGCAEKEPVTPNYSASPFLEVEVNASELTDKEIKSFISKIPSDQYETYPSTQNLPLSATLYKDGETISLDVTDPRLIRLINFFNNALYHEQCAYRLSYIPREELEEEIMGEAFRLELKYEPYGEERPGPYENGPTQFDTMIVTNFSAEFVLINHDFPIYVNDQIEHPYLAAGYEPYFGGRHWLDLFGF